MKFARTAVAAAALVASAVALAAPGVPADPIVIFTEDFENGPAPTVTSPIQSITGYVGAGGQTYSADPAWASHCNGWVAANANGGNSPARDPQITDCNGVNNWNSARSIAQMLGTHAGRTDPENNYAVTAYTSGDPGAGKVEFEMTTPIALSQAGRFIAFSVDVAAMNCHASHPQLQFSLVNGNQVIPAGTAIDGCGGLNAGSQTGTYPSGSVLFNGSSVGIRMTNANGSGAGNDHGFDNIRILDATPQVDKAYGPAQLNPGETATLTITITNTKEQGEKTGWGFTETLPPGLQINGPILSDCSTTPAVAGNVITVANGSLADDTTYCTISIPVTSATAGHYTSPPARTSGILGLNPPAATSVTFGTPGPQSVPTQGTWGLLLTGSALAVLALRRRRNA